MAEYKERQQDLRLYNVRTITSLEQINDISENVLNSSYAVFAYDNDRTKRYVSHKVKFSDIMDEAFKRSWTYIDVLRDEVEYFLHNLDLRFNKTYLNIVKEPIENGFHDWHNQRLSYFFTINPIISELNEEPDSYIVSYIPEHIVDGVVIPGEYSYLHSSYLTPGLISYTVLQDYIDNTLERLMGVPMTKEQQDQAINSLQEFVNWFTNYTYTDEEYGNLQRLIDTMDRKDENVRLLSYAYTDLARELSYAYTASERDKLSTSINNTFNGLNFTYSCEEHRYLTGIKQVNGKIIEVTDNEGGSNIEVDQNNNTISVSGTEYTLSMTNGKLGLYPYTAINLTNVTSTQHFERDSGNKTVTLSAKPTKNCTVTNRWEDNSAGTTYNAGVAISASVTITNNSTPTYDLTVKETDNNGTKTATVKAYYDIYSAYIFASNNSNLSQVITSRQTRPQASVAVTDGKYITSSSAIDLSTTINIGSTAQFIYIVVPTNWTSSRSPYYGSNFPETTRPENIGSATFYTNNTNYTVIRSNDPIPGNITVEFK